jgi:histidinol-phosphate aminotransferase
MKPRAALDGVTACEHGGKREDGNVGDIIDFSVNLNPYGPPNFVLDAIQESVGELSLYPDTDCTELREKVSQKFDCEVDEVLVGAGVSELIQLVALAFVKQRVLIPEHTYGEYAVATTVMGANVKFMQMPSLQIIPGTLVEELKAGDVVFLCNPNNPTGQYISKPDIELIIEEAERVDALVVLDEAYVDFVRDAIPAHELSTRNMIILRSLTKSFAIPGLRIGYAISSEEHIGAMRKIKVPWSVSVCAQKVGAAVIGTQGDMFLAQTREKIEASKRRIEKRLKIFSDANFYIAEVGNGREVKNKLLKDGIRVRDCTSFGLHSYIRCSVRKDEENDLLMHFLSNYCNLYEEIA